VNIIADPSCDFVAVASKVSVVARHVFATAVLAIVEALAINCIFVLLGLLAPEIAKTFPLSPQTTIIPAQGELS